MSVDTDGGSVVVKLAVVASTGMVVPAIGSVRTNRTFENMFKSLKF